MRNVLYLGILLFNNIFISCNAQQSEKKSHVEISYERERINFDTTLTSHFPTDLLSLDSLEFKRRERVEFNDISFFLYEYDLSNELIDATLSTLGPLKFVAKYQSTDSCLLIVNRFERRATYDNFAAPQVTDSSLINQDCYADLLPIPNFIDYNGDNITSCGLDKTFIIYVLEAKPQMPFTQFDLQPFKHMPEKWSNGYSRGIAISKENKIVIYWSIVW